MKCVVKYIFNHLDDRVTLQNIMPCGNIMNIGLIIMRFLLLWCNAQVVITVSKSTIKINTLKFVLHASYQKEMK